MSQLEIFNVKYTQYDIAPITDDNVIRLIADDKIFFFYQSQFSDAIEKLTVLTNEQPVQIATHKLRNGNYWLHWLTADDIIILEPKNKDNEMDSLLKASLVSGLSVLIFLGIFIEVQDKTIIGILFLISLIFFSSCIKGVVDIIRSPFFIALKIFKTKQGIEESSSADSVRKYLTKTGIMFLIEKVENINIFQSNSIINEEIFKDKKLDDFGLQTDTVNIKNINIDNDIKVSKIKIRSSIKTIIQYFNYYTISSENNDYYVTTHDSKNGSAYEKKIHHPFFISVEDDVDIISEKNTNNVIGLYNYKDNSAYLFRKQGDGNFSNISNSDILKIGLYIFGGIFFVFELMFLFISSDSLVSFVIFIFSLFTSYLTMIYLFFKKSKYRADKDKCLFVEKYLKELLLKNKQNSDVMNILNIKSIPFHMLRLNND